MTQVREMLGRDLRWTQPRMTQRTFELKDGETTVMTLRYDRPFGSAATLESEDGTWSFARKGFWNPEVEVRPEAAKMPELPWIIGLGWYLSIKMQSDAGGAAAAAAAAG